MDDHTTDQRLTKQCCHCGREFPRTKEYFYSDSRNKDGLFGRCKECYNAAGRARYVGERREETLAKQREYRGNFPERRKNTLKRYYENNKESIRSRRKIYFDSEKGKVAKKAWIAANHEKRKAIANRYARKKSAERAALNPPAKPLTDEEQKQRKIMKWHKRKAQKLSLPNDFTHDDWDFALAYFRDGCAICGRPAGLLHTISVDHWCPIAAPDCPGHIPSNIVPLCHGVGGCNNSKGNRHPEQWLKAKFGDKKAEAILTRIHEFFSKVRQV